MQQSRFAHLFNSSPSASGSTSGLTSGSTSGSNSGQVSGSVSRPTSGPASGQSFSDYRSEFAMFSPMLLQGAERLENLSLTLRSHSVRATHSAASRPRDPFAGIGIRSHSRAHRNSLAESSANGQEADRVDDGRVDKSTDREKDYSLENAMDKSSDGGQVGGELTVPFERLSVVISSRKAPYGGTIVTSREADGQISTRIQYTSDEIRRLALSPFASLPPSTHKKIVIATPEILTRYPARHGAKSRIATLADSKRRDC